MKTKMKILIFGAKGWIGGMLVKEWKRLYPEDEIGESMVRVQPQNIQELRAEISEYDRVICCIGRTSGTLPSGQHINTIDYCETNLEANLRQPCCTYVTREDMRNLRSSHALHWYWMYLQLGHQRKHRTSRDRRRVP